MAIEDLVTNHSFPRLAGLTWRLVTSDDLPALVALAEACRRADGGLAFMNEPETVRERFFGDSRGTAVGAFAARSMVAGSAVHIARAGEVTRAVMAGYVRPEWRGQGFGRYLLRWSEAHGRHYLAAETGQRVLQVATESLTDEADRLYRAWGFAPVHEDLVMVRPLEGALPERPLPPDVTLAPWEPALTAQFFQAYDVAFRDRPGFPGWTAEEWISGCLTDEDFMPEWSLLAQLDGRPVGFLTAATARPGGFVVQVGVVPALRRRGLGGALMVAAMALMQAAGEPLIQLTVNVNNPGAIALYRRLGFGVDGRRARYERKEGKE